MKLLFRTIVDDEKIEYTTDLEALENGFSFVDKTLNNLIYIYKEQDWIYLRRLGSVTQEMRFKEGVKSLTKYENNEGLALDLEIKTIKAKLTETGFFLHYNLLMDKKVISDHKILGKVVK